MLLDVKWVGFHPPLTIYSNFKYASVLNVRCRNNPYFQRREIQPKTLNTMGLIVTLGMTRHCIECHYDECRVLFIDMLNVLILSATMLKYRYYECPSTERHLAVIIFQFILMKS